MSIIHLFILAIKLFYFHYLKYNFLYIKISSYYIIILLYKYYFNNLNKIIYKLSIVFY